MLPVVRDRGVYQEIQTLRGRERFQGLSPAALEIHVRAVERSARTQWPAFVEDAVLDRLAPGPVTTITALELTLAGVWDRAEGGYVVSDLDLVDRYSAGLLSRCTRQAGQTIARCWRAVNRDNFIPL